MKLIRRKRTPTPAQRVLDIVRKVLRGLVAVRMLRTAYGTYKLARRLPLLIGLAAAGAAIAAALRRLRGSSDGPQTETWSPPAPATSPSSSTSSPSSAPPAGTSPSASAPETTAAAPAPSPAPELTPNPAETAATGTPPVEPELEPATPPSVSAQAEDDDVADAPGESSEASTEDASKT